MPGLCRALSTYRVSKNSHLARKTDIYRLTLQANTYLYEVTRASMGMHKAFDRPLTRSLRVRVAPRRK